MKLSIEPGRYVVAVSGGVDSVVLLDILARQPGLELIVAHFDHGIRTDSAKDRLFVEGLAAKYGYLFEFEEGKMGASASEAEARQARYDFLDRMRNKHQAASVVTAHHQDDVIETAIINLYRGTGRRGLSSLSSTELIKRPLLDVSKQELIGYAKSHKLTWHEDPTNLDLKYKRNYVRYRIVPTLSQSDRKKLLKLINRTALMNNSLDGQISGLIKNNISYNDLDRLWFTSLPHAVAKEVLLYWLRQQGVTSLDRRQVEQLTVKLKTHGDSKRFSIDDQTFIKLNKQYLALQHIDR
jgi:tRNA(Ile)-lysidine synthetase-like protein